MNGMLSRTSGNSLPPAQLKHQILQSKTSPVQAQKRHCKSSVWQRSRSGGEIEPTSVLDIRSPSPTSTLSSSLGGSSESAGAVAAVSGGLLCEAVSDGGGGGSGGAETLLLDSSAKEAFNNGSGSTTSPARWYPNRGGGREGFGWRLNNGEQQPGGGGMVEGKSEVKKEEPQQQSRAEEWGSGGGAGTAGGMEDLESMLFESGAGAPDQSLMRWLLGEIEDPKDVPPPQIKAATSGGSASAAQFEDPSIEPNFADPAAFAFTHNNLSDVIAPPQPAPIPSSFRPSYPTLPNPPQQQFIPPPPPPPPPPFANNAPMPTAFVPNAYHSEVLFPAPAVYGSNPTQHFGPDFPRFNIAADPTRPNNNLLFDMPLPPPPKRFGLEHQLWQQTFKQQEYMNMMKPQHQQELLQSLHRRQQFLHQPLPPPPPHHHQQHHQLRQKAIVNNTFKVGGPGAAAEEVQVIVEQLLKAAEAVELGTLDHAQAILARLNQHLSPLGKPLHRAAFYFKEALASRILNTTNTGGDNRNATGTGTGSSTISSPLDMVHKISAYKSFSEASPLAQFAHFTANQALLEALEGAEAIHIIDFEIGLGGQWASFLQELAVKLGGAPHVRLTALGSSASSSLELHLTRDNLCNFAKQLNVPFEFELLHLDHIESLTLREREAVAVNLSLLPSTFTSPDSIPRLIRLIKNLAPRAIVVVDAETTATAAAAASAATTSAASFVHHFLEALQFYSFLFDSLDAVNITMDAVHKIEKFLLAPKIDATISSAAAPPWKTLFAAAGFSPVAFSNFTETQAEYLIQRLHGRGFEVLKAHTALLLGWQGRPLVSATAWRCGPPP